MNRSLLVIWGVLMVLLFVSCGKKNSVRVFEFSSGGAYHPQGFGEWILAANNKGSFGIRHNVRGDFKEYGVHDLTTDENRELWECIEGVKLTSLTPVREEGYPDEAQYTLSLNEGEKLSERKLWSAEAQENQDFSYLISNLERLTRKYSGVRKATLR